MTRSHVLAVYCWSTLALLVGACERPNPARGGVSATPITRNEQVELERWGRQLRGLLAAGRYDTLDALATQLRGGERLPDGRWRLFAFYAYGFGETDRDEEAEWKALLDQTSAWRNARPLSVTAPVALAVALESYAWKARGGGYAFTVSAEERRQMTERLAEAWNVLELSYTLQPRCPGWYNVALRVAHLAHAPAVLFDSLFNEAITYAPDYWSLYVRKSTWLEPWWYGKPGDLEAFAQQAADGKGGTEGDMLYAWIARWTLDNTRRDFEDIRLDWARVHRGMQALEQRYPNSRLLVNIHAWLAVKAKDKIGARQILERMQLRYDPEVWGTDDSEFVRAYEWAMAD